jgi:hypothetical protein
MGSIPTPSILSIWLTMALNWVHPRDEITNLSHFVSFLLG